MLFRSRKSRKRKENMALPAETRTISQCGGRVSFHTSLKAGLTVETACVLPFFLWAVLGAYYLIEVSLIQTRLLGGIREAGEKLALLSYAVYGGQSEEEKGIGIGDVIGGTLSAVYAKRLILDRAGLESSPLWEQTTISLAGSDFSDQNLIDIQVFTGIRIPVPLYQIKKLRFLERGRVRAWTGRSPENGQEEEKEEGEMVYVTSTGSVYHRDINCSHIHLSIRSANVGSMETLRNTGGGKYYPCSCYQKGSTGTVYYTTTGNRYHSSLGCSRLKRTVRKVELSTVEGLRPCSKCG